VNWSCSPLTPIVPLTMLPRAIGVDGRGSKRLYRKRVVRRTRPRVKAAFDEERVRFRVA
jgi:hypothetical protein